MDHDRSPEYLADENIDTVIYLAKTAGERYVKDDVTMP
jgi:hypothetical protein